MRRLTLLIVLLLSCSAVLFGQSSDYATGLDYFQKGDYANAITALTKAANTADANQQKAKVKLEQAKKCQDAMERAKNAYANKQYQKAKDAYNEVLALNSKDAVAKQGVANCDKMLSQDSSSGGSSSNPTLSVSTSTQYFSSAGETKTLSVTCSSSWSVVSSPTGFTATKKSSSQLTITASANSTTSKRSGKVRIATSDGSVSRDIPVEQYAASATLDLSSHKITFPASGGTQNVSVSGNESWYHVTSGASWFSSSQRIDKTTNSGTITVTASVNSSTSSRSGTITVKNSSGKSETINVTQQGAETTLSASSLSFNWSYTSGSENVTITTNASSYSVNSTPSWCTVSRNGNTLTLSRTTNYSSSSRSGTIGISAGNKSLSISVTQRAYPSSSSSSSSGSYSRTRSRHYYNGMDEKAFRIGWSFGLEACDEKFGLGTGLMMRVGRFDSIFNLVSGIRYQYLADYPETDEYGNYIESDGESTGYVLVPVELQFKLSNWDQDSDFSIYMGGGFEYDLMNNGGTGGLGKIGIKTANLDMNLYLKFSDYTLFGFGAAIYF